MYSLESGPSTSGVEPRKFPFSRIKRPLDQILTVALPLHIQALNEHSEKIEQLKNEASSQKLWVEQTFAARALKLLKADLYEIEQMNFIVQDQDRDLFYSKIKSPIKEAVETLTNFMNLHPGALEPFPEISENNTLEFPKLICHLDQESEDTVVDYHPSPAEPVVVKATLTSTGSTFPDWSFLRKEFLEIQSLIGHFSRQVFSQKEKVDSIQNNVEKAHENVQEGASFLKKAAILKTASFPIAGAIVGGIILGPIGSFVGLKLFGTAACIASGGALGYKTGAIVKKKREMLIDMEMKALTYPDKEKSSSNPELSTREKDS